jgi:hypothetical protein
MVQLPVTIQSLLVSFMSILWSRSHANSSLSPNDRPQYKTTADIKCRLSTLILGDLGDAIRKHLAKIDEMLKGTPRDVSFSKSGWEGKLLYQAGSTEQRSSFASSYMDLLSNFEPPEGYTF